MAGTVGMQGGQLSWVILFRELICHYFMCLRLGMEDLLGTLYSTRQLKSNLLATIKYLPGIYFTM